MSETNPAQSRLGTPFTLGVGFSGQYFLKPLPEASAINKHELAINTGFRKDIKAKDLKAKFQLEWRFLNANIEWPGAFEKANSYSLTTGLWFRFLTPKDSERGGIIPWIQAGTVRRGFSVAHRIPAPEEGIDPNLPPPPAEECGDAAMDNPFGNPEGCNPAQQETILVRRSETRWGFDGIVGLSAGFQVFAGKEKRDLLNLTAELRLRSQFADSALPRAALRSLVGVSTGFHPKTAKFLTLSARVGPEVNLITRETSWFIQLGLQLTFDTNLRGQKK